MSKTLEYFLAPQSPWAYLGHRRLSSIVQETQAELQIKPADMVKVFSVSGGIPVAQRPPQRQAYRLHELQRWSELLHTPLNLHPEFFPVASDTAAKLIIAATQSHTTQQALQLAGALGAAVWAEQKNIADPSSLIQIADQIGLPGAELLDLAGSEAVAAQYLRNTEEAIEAQVFGVPWYRVDGEGFWGQDRLDFVERKLRA
jgi:2-hydroxychromene-2-carboxylate isomerase